jgi:hypothetical protein
MNGSAAMPMLLPQYIITRADRKRQQETEYARQAFECELEDMLEPMPDAPDDNVTDSIDEKVEAAVAFLFGKELEITVEDTNGDATAAAQELIDTVWGVKERRIPLLAELSVNGMLGGQGIIRIKPQKNGALRLVVLDPASVFVKTMPQDCKVPKLFCIEYSEEETGPDGRPVNVYYREEIARVDPDADESDDYDPFGDSEASWLVQHWTRQGEQGNWFPAGDPLPWPWSFPPIFSCQNRVRPNNYWGRPDVTKNLVKLVESFNTTNSTTQKLGRIMAGALIWAKGTGVTDLEPEPGKIVILPSPDSEMGAVPLQLDFAGLQGIADRLQSRIDERTGVPGIATGRASAMPGGNMSGIAIELLFMSLIKRNDMKKCLYGGLILDVSRAILIMSGFSPDIKLSLKWQNPLPNDDLSSWQAAALAKQSGVSDQTILEERGYDSKEEMERNREEDAMKMIAFSRGQGMPPGQPAPAMQGQMVGNMGANSEQPQGDPGAASSSPFIGRNL